MNARLCAGDVCDVARVVDARDCDDVCGGGAVVDDSGNDDEGDEDDDSDSADHHHHLMPLWRLTANSDSTTCWQTPAWISA